MKKVEKEKQKNNFTKLTHKRGISLIVLIVTIIVIIILAAAIILTISKNNPVSSAKEATFKEDMVSIQDELSMYISKKYTDDPISFDKSSVNLSGDTSTSNKTGIPVRKKGATVWINISYTNSKASAESMMKNEYVQTGLITGKAWDTTCHWIKDSLSSINKLASLTNSRYYGNYKDSLAPANENSGTKRTAGFSENWKTKNIYDLAGNVWEWTSEADTSVFIFRGGSYDSGGSDYPVSYRDYNASSDTFNSVGFRPRLYIK